MNRVEEYLELHNKLKDSGIKGIVIQHAYSNNNIENSMYFTMSAMEIVMIFSMFKDNINKIDEEIKKRNLEPVLIQIIDALKKIAIEINVKTTKVIEFDDNCPDKIKLI